MKKRDYILYWNELTLEVNKLSHSAEEGEQKGPCLSSRALGIIHLAMYEAFAVIAKDPDYPTYFPSLPPPPAGSSIDAAITGAAYVTISALYPSMQPLAYDRYLKCELEGPGVNDGVAYGCLVAQIILQDRGNDPSVNGFAHVPAIGKTGHRVDPANPSQSYNGPNYGPLSKGFAVTNRWTILPPPAPTSTEYRRSLRQVREKGIATELMRGPHKRTVNESLIGLFWAYDGAKNIGSPPRLYNQMVRKVAQKKNNTQAMNARLFALINVAMADAAMLSWDAKYIFNLNRPVIAIREDDPCLGLVTKPGHTVNDEANIDWLPFGAPNSNRLAKNFTPNFPSYPSGHATFGAAAFQITRLFYGIKNMGPDNLFEGLSFVSDELNGITSDNTGTIRPRHEREFPGGLYQMIIENGFSRVFLGVHFSFDAFATDAEGNPKLNENTGGVPLGVKIAEDIFKNGLKPSKVLPRYPLIPKLI